MDPAWIEAIRGVACEPLDENLQNILNDLADQPTWIDSVMLRRIAEAKNGNKLYEAKTGNALKRNSDKALERITSLAFTEDDPETQIRLLCGLDGVRVPTASAILAWRQPNLFGVFDVMACEGLRALGVADLHPQSVSDWTIYLRIIREVSDFIGERPFDVDRRLWSYGRLKRKERRSSERLKPPPPT